MGVRVLKDEEQGYSCLYCSTTMWAFGGLFYAHEDADDFLEWLENTTHTDARKFTDKELSAKIHEWRESVEKEIIESQFN